MDLIYEVRVGHPEVPERTVRVRHRFIKGVHVYTSEDVYGLYVTGADEDAARAAVAPAIEILLRHNEGIECRAEPTSRPGMPRLMR